MWNINVWKEEQTFRHEKRHHRQNYLSKIQNILERIIMYRSLRAACLNHYIYTSINFYVILFSCSFYLMLEIEIYKAHSVVVVGITDSPFLSSGAHSKAVFFVGYLRDVALKGFDMGQI